MNKSKKGGDYERQVCKVLSLWYSRGERDDIFWRTSGSGARATIRKKSNLNTADSAGDVQAIHESGKAFTRLVNIEIKRGYTQKDLKKQSHNNKISLTSLIDTKLDQKGKPGILIQWIDKGLKECQLHNKKHLLIIYRRDRRRSCILMLKHTFDYLSENNRLFIFPHDGTYCNIATSSGRNIIIIPFEDFLSWCPPRAFFQKINRIKRRTSYKHNQGKYAGAKIEKFRSHNCFPKDFC